jgi:hypothetical protein
MVAFNTLQHVGLCFVLCVVLCIALGLSRCSACRIIKKARPKTSYCLLKNLLLLKNQSHYDTVRTIHNKFYGLHRFALHLYISCS